MDLKLRSSAMRITRGLLLKPTLNLLERLLKRDGNSVIIGGPLGWSWQPTIDAAHHGSLLGPANAHRHSDLAGIGPDDHHARDHAPRHQDGGADEISLAGLDGEPIALTTHKNLSTNTHGLGPKYFAGVRTSGQVQVVRTATLVVAANNSSALAKSQADYICDGTADNEEIQAAFNALPSGGGEVVLLEGTYNIAASIILSSNQTLRGCNRNTVLTTPTSNLIFIKAEGSPGSEKVGIVIADLQIDGANVSDVGIYFSYVDYSVIRNVYSRRHASATGSYLSGIYLLYSDFNTITACTCRQNGYEGIYLSSCLNNILNSNTCQGNGADGIWLVSSLNNTISGNNCQGNAYGINIESSQHNTITGNVCQGNTYGIYLYSSSHNTVSGNTCRQNTSEGIYLLGGSSNTIGSNTCQGNTYQGIFLSGSSNSVLSGNTCRENGQHGIYLTNSSNHNALIGNNSVANSQTTTNTYDDICLLGSSYNNIQGNTCRAGPLTKKPRYGINLGPGSNGNLVMNNDLYNDGFGTGPFINSGTGTRMRFALSNMPDGPNGYVLVGQGTGNDPVYSQPFITAIAKPKTADETVNNSATLQNDDHLFFPVTAGECWYLEFVLIGNSGTTPDFKFTIVAPSGSSGGWWRGGDIGALAAAGAITPTGLGTAAMVDGAGADRVMLLYAFVIAGSSGNIQLQWAQNTANASNTIVKAYSFLLAFRYW